MERVKKCKSKNVQTERLSHSSVHPSAHMTATSKYAICSSQHGEKRNKAQMKNAITQLHKKKIAPCALQVIMPAISHKSVITCIYRQTQAHK